LAALSSEQESATREISILSERLAVRRSELREIKKDLCWSVRSALKARTDDLDAEIQAIVDEIFTLRDKAEMAKRRMHELAQQRQLLLRWY
jgi:chromosome segregation ATPase